MTSNGSSMGLALSTLAGSFPNPSFKSSSTYLSTHTTLGGGCRRKRKEERRHVRFSNIIALENANGESAYPSSPPFSSSLRQVSYPSVRPSSFRRIGTSREDEKNDR